MGGKKMSIFLTALILGPFYQEKGLLKKSILR
jgi:hypothetical protein